MERAGLPVFPGSTEPVTDLATAVAEAAVRIKAASALVGSSAGAVTWHLPLSIASRTSRRPCGSSRNAAA